VSKEQDELFEQLNFGETEESDQNLHRQQLLDQVEE
jgi:hypothetical protein